MSYAVVGHVVVAVFLAVFTLIAIGALALQVLGVLGRLHLDREKHTREPSGHGPDGE